VNNPKLAASVVALFLAAGGGFMLGIATNGKGQNSSSIETPAGEQTYTCSMHPQVRLDGPGKCPICEMPLIPAASASSSSEKPMLQLSDHALAMASVETTAVVRRDMARDLRAVGKIQYNETSLATVTARVDGYAERLFVNFTGVEIKAGDHLAEVYSPDLIVAQQELLIALQSSGGQPAGPLVDSAKMKLWRWGMNDRQIKELAASRKIAPRITLYSPIQGTVIEKSIVENSAFKAGDALYRVANLDSVWVYLDIYEYDLAWIRYGQRVDLTADAIPGRTFEGMVTFVQPVVNEESRTIRVPVHIENKDHALKPGMFVSAVIRSALAQDGSAAPTGVEGKFTCPMHPQILRENAGSCPLCEMGLEKIPGVAPEREHGRAPHTAPVAPLFGCPMECEAPAAQPGNCSVCGMKLESIRPSTPPDDGRLLAVPITAVLDSGTRRIVYVESTGGLFELREVVLGPRAGEFFPVLRGLTEAERVVTRGGFLIDSQFQITGHPSLFYPGGLMGGSNDHRHGASSTPDPAAAAPKVAAPHAH
jgi:Cu(I)/Ag(I) efflux system membrane fusion protein